MTQEQHAEIIQRLDKTNELLQQLLDRLSKTKEGKGTGVFKLVGFEETQNYTTIIDERETQREIMELAGEYRGKYDRLFVIDPSGKKKEI